MPASSRQNKCYRILLLKGDTAAGGISTISDTLATALRAAGHEVESAVMQMTAWRHLLHGAQRNDLIIATNSFKPAYAAWLLARIFRKPIIVWCHGPIQEVLRQAKTGSVKRNWLRWLYRQIRHQVFVSEHSRRSMQQFIGSTPSAHQTLSVIPNAAPDWQVKRPQPCEDGPPWQLGFVGRLSPEKNPQALLKTLEQLPDDYCLCITGDGHLMQQLQERGNQLHATERLNFNGFQPSSPALYASWHLTMLTSLYEGCPMAALESLTMGVPCVGYPIPSLQEMLSQDMPYALASDCTSTALAHTVQAVCAMPRTILEKDMARVLARYSPEQFTKSWLQLIQSAVSAQ
jgi:glycosyltransferase involved in cell wall biosynthesis